ncbi:fasciclin domain-containing protein [Rhodohalobacter halophilus]|uniref:fasciclin domain-containing protein n=1 Tax=Rhodohalobacter halophilus TaxID=1812810 RepID=UPI0038B44696
MPRDIKVALEIPSLVEVAEEAGNFETLLSLVEEAGLTTTLQFLGPYTAFAPTDEAFANLGVDAGSLSTEELTFILTYHVIADAEIASGDLQAQQTVASAAGEDLYITAGEEGVFVNGNSEVISPDVDAANGIIHVVDNVLLPNAFLNNVQVAQKNYNFTTLVDLIVDADLVETVATTELTVFAPTNDAFEALFAEVDPTSLSAQQIEDILFYHTVMGTILSGDLQTQQTVESTLGEDLYITVNGEVGVNGNSTVVAADIQSTSGVIHAVDNVLLPNELLNTVEVAQKNYNFTTLVSLISDAGLADAVASNEITVFAPTNDAFDALFETVDASSLTGDQIEDILLYHTILGAQVPSTALAPEQTVESGSGESLYITADNGGVVVNGSSNVITADITSGSDGTIHVIDSVLLPNAFQDITAIAQKNYDLSTLVGLLVDFELVETLQGDGPFTVFAPTNAAFEAIESVVAGLTEEQIVDVLTYHVLAANVESGDLQPTQTVEMLNEQEITITVSGGIVTIEDANGDTPEVIVADLIGTNGVIHIIDAVLVPAL